MAITKEYRRAYVASHREQNRECQRKYRATHPNKVKEWNAKQRKRKLALDPHYRRWEAIWKRYKLRQKDWESLYKKQGGVCAICGRISVNTGNKNNLEGLVVDHNHKTGRVRGLLCHNCNLTLGKFDDEAEWFLKAAKYVKEAR